MSLIPFGVSSAAFPGVPQILVSISQEALDSFRALPSVKSRLG